MDSNQPINLTSLKSIDLNLNNQDVRECYTCKSCNILFNLKRHNKYVQCQKVNRTKTSFETNKQNLHQTERTSEKIYDAKDVISMFEDHDLEYISPILWAMNQPQLILKWDRDSGEIFYLKCCIPGTNILKLLTCTLTGTTNVIGIVQFCIGLHMLSVLLYIFKHSRKKKILKALHEDL